MRRRFGKAGFERLERMLSYASTACAMGFASLAACSPVQAASADMPSRTSPSSSALLIMTDLPAIRYRQLVTGLG